MRIVFAGTPAFAAVSLRALIAAGHDIPLVLTQPDRPAGRGMSSQPSPVKAVAQAAGLAVHQPPNLKSPEAAAPIAAAAAEWMVVAAYGLILPQSVLDLPSHGCLNLHASLLPRWRGAAPIQRALLAGDAETGICLMRMAAGLDTGPVYARRATAITASDTAQTLHDRLADLAADLLLAELPGLAARHAVPQPADGVTYAAKLSKDEAPLDWRQAAALLARQVRAFDPFPGATGSLDGTILKVWSAHVGADGAGASPGTVIRVVRDGLTVACGDGTLVITEVQKPGGRRQPIAAYLSGRAIRAGDAFTLPTPRPGP